ncbi:MAG: archaeosortase/exosortase family protein [Desulfuromonadales bacterium]|nr:archaeosortase/exosortase family protein [Desulfuromonadales bacterium]
MAKKKKNIKPESILAEQSIQKEAGANNRPGSSLVKTCMLFALFLVTLHAFTWLFALKGYIQWGYGTAHIVSSILNASGIQNTVDYNIIHLRNDTWNVTSECTAVNAVFLFISFILAYSSSFKSKALGLITGIPLILVTNIVRLVALGWVTEYWPKHSHLFHDYVWETIFLFFIVALWFIWINLVVSREKTAAVSC